MFLFKKKKKKKKDGDKLAHHGILFPAATWDYSVTAKSSRYGGGYGLVAARNIKKGEMVFSDSVEFTFTDVVDIGDYLIFDEHRKASRRTGTKVPAKFPLTRDVLLRTHGVPALKDMGDDDIGTTTRVCYWQLEVPGMLMNHSCDPNVRAYPRSSDKAEDYAIRDIRKGEELTVDYVLQYYDHGPLFKKCLCCGSSNNNNCRKSMMGFKALTDSEKEKLFSQSSDAVQAMHLADTKQDHSQLKHEQPTFPPRCTTAPASEVVRGGSIVRKMVFPGPSHALADVLLLKRNDDNDDGMLAMYAAKDFHFGERVYEFWSQPWPIISGGDGKTKKRTPIIMDWVFASKLMDGDPPEGTVVRLDPYECGAPRDRGGMVMFTGFDLFTTHSCDPNLVYNHKHDEGEEWRSAYAARDIKVGEQITVDYNSLHWDRTANKSSAAAAATALLGSGDCCCGSAKCTGTMMGFKFLSRDIREERKLMSWKRLSPPYEGQQDEKLPYPGEALSPHVRVCWRIDSNFGDDAPETDESSGSSSSSSED